jgi:hypothetical protein
LGLAVAWGLTATFAIADDTPVDESVTSVVQADGATEESANQPAPAGQPTPASRSGQASFVICGPDAAAERAIEQLIGGRTSFSTSLQGRSDGCVDLTIRVDPAAQMNTGGRQSTRQTVSTGRGPRISVEIVSESGVTRAAIWVA